MDNKMKRIPTEEELKMLEMEITNEGEEEGYPPYNTGKKEENKESPNK